MKGPRAFGAAGCELNTVQKAAVENALAKLESLTRFGEFSGSKRDVDLQQMWNDIRRLPHGELLLQDQDIDLETLKSVLCENFRKVVPDKCR